jgi:hypothetical protein
MSLPTELLRQIAAPSGGRVVLVIGAGASMEPPTGFESGKNYSIEMHRQLLLDGVLEEGDCADPSDLSLLAEAVFLRSNGSQKELTRRLPKQAWRQATPNSGHRLAAALLIEGNFRHIITLSYDLGVQNALSALGARGEVSVLRGPEDHNEAGARSLIFLHRSVEADEEDWVLRKALLDNGWRDSWEAIIASAVLSAPAIVFAGLGSPAAVLTESVKNIAAASSSEYFLVDPDSHSKFADALDGSLSGTVAMEWCAFMAELAGRVMEDQWARVAAQVAALETDRALVIGQSVMALDAVHQLDLEGMGRVRSSWLLADSPYLAETSASMISCMADLILGISSAVIALGVTELDLETDGRVVVTDGDNARFAFHAVHAEGYRSWASICVEVARRMSGVSATKRSRNVLVSGLATAPDSTPVDLVRDTDSEDLIRGADVFVLTRAEEIGIAGGIDGESLRSVLSK